MAWGAGTPSYGAEGQAGPQQGNGSGVTSSTSTDGESGNKEAVDGGDAGGGNGGSSVDAPSMPQQKWTAEEEEGGDTPGRRQCSTCLSWQRLSCFPRKRNGDRAKTCPPLLRKGRRRKQERKRKALALRARRRARHAEIDED